MKTKLAPKIIKTMTAIRAIAKCAPYTRPGRFVAPIPEVATAFAQMAALLKSQLENAGLNELEAWKIYDEEAPK